MISRNINKIYSIYFQKFFFSVRGLLIDPFRPITTQYKTLNFYVLTNKRVRQLMVHELEKGCVGKENNSSRFSCAKIRTEKSPIRMMRFFPSPPKNEKGLAPSTYPKLFVKCNVNIRWHWRNSFVRRFLVLVINLVMYKGRLRQPHRRIL